MPPQTANNKVLEFVGTPGGFFVMYLVSALMNLIPFVGFAMSFNYSAKWMAENTKVNGRQLSYSAKLGETWVLLFVGILLTIVTLGIYIFWLTPKVYRYAYDHIHYADEVPAPTAPTAVPDNGPSTPPTSGVVNSSTDSNSSAPTPPTTPLVQ